ncbi:MAG: hypothetical protein M3014_04615, partial [Chloroflexota bacterium]|nr:hypothetical protein [Chloroflexota bacterium]
DKQIILWDIAHGEPVRNLEGQASAALTVSISADGRLAVAGTVDGTIFLWDVSSGNLRRVFRGHTRTVTRVTFTPDGRRVLSGAADKTVREWRVDESDESLREWIAANRYIPELTWQQRAHYGIQPLHNERAAEETSALPTK